MHLIGPGDPGYDRHRAVFDRRVDRRPAAIARCRTRDDVAAALAHARDRRLDFAVRGGGATERATIDGGLVIDVSAMKGVDVDPVGRTARVSGGVTWAELDAAAQAHGLAVTGGRVSWLGVVGVARGEGRGWLERSLGPTGDHVADVETVDDAVVTALTLRLHPVGPELLCGFLGFPRERALDVARAYRDLMAHAPPAVGGALTLFAGRGGGVQLTFCFAGEPGEGDRWLAPLRALGPSLDAVALNPYCALQAMTDTQHPFDMRAELRADTLDALEDDVLEAIVAAADRPAAALARVTLRPRGGALGGAPWNYECLGMWPPVDSLDRGMAEWVDVASASSATPSRA